MGTTRTILDVNAIRIFKSNSIISDKIKLSFNGKIEILNYNYNGFVFCHILNVVSILLKFQLNSRTIRIKIKQKSKNFQ